MKSNTKFCFLVFFSTKHLKNLSKNGESPFFLGGDGKNPIFRYIYDLLHDCIRGAAKKDAVSTILADLTVSIPLQNGDTRCDLFILFDFVIVCKLGNAH